LKNILVGSRDEVLLRTIKNCLGYNYAIDSAVSSKASLDIFATKKYDFVFIDISFLDLDNNKDYKKHLKAYWNIFPDTEIIVLTPSSLIRNAVEIVKAGASDYLTIPLNKDDIKYVVERIEEQSRIKSELDYHRNIVLTGDSLNPLRTNSSLMKEIYNDIRSVAKTNSTVLITGETGTGKGVFAKLLHQHSQRSNQQFIAVHCGAIPDNLLESDLFGHEKGAFTGAIRRKLGKFEIAEGGTIFLDEIGTISTSMQVKLLQVLQDKIFYRVGGEQPVQSDVRIIAATNSNLEKMGETGEFRTDLYYRLNVFQIEAPPLRDRLEDIILLVESIIERLNKFNKKEITGVHEEVLQAFNEYEWPGNIRELENLIERAFILEESQILTPKSFPIRLFKEKFRKLVSQVDTNKSLEEVRHTEIERVEKEYLKEQLKTQKGKIKQTALAAGLSERQLHNLMVKYHLDKVDFKNSM